MSHQKYQFFTLCWFACYGDGIGRVAIELFGAISD